MFHNNCVRILHLFILPVCCSHPKMEETGGQQMSKPTVLLIFLSLRRKICLIFSSTTQSLRKCWPEREGETKACRPITTACLHPQCCCDFGEAHINQLFEYFLT